MKRHLTEEELIQRKFKLASDEQGAEHAEHLAGCAECRERLEMLFQPGGSSAETTRQRSLQAAPISANRTGCNRSLFRNGILSARKWTQAKGTMRVRYDDVRMTPLPAPRRWSFE